MCEFECEVEFDFEFESEFELEFESELVPAGDYVVELVAKLEVTAACEAITSALATSEAKAMQFRDQFLRFSQLWTRQPADSLQVAFGFRV